MAVIFPSSTQNDEWQNYVIWMINNIIREVCTLIYSYVKMNSVCITWSLAALPEYRMSSEAISCKKYEKFDRVSIFPLNDISNQFHWTIFQTSAIKRYFKHKADGRKEKGRMRERSKGGGTEREKRARETRVIWRLHYYQWMWHVYSDSEMVRIGTTKILFENERHREGMMISWDIWTDIAWHNSILTEPAFWYGHLFFDLLSSEVHDTKQSVKLSSGLLWNAHVCEETHYNTNVGFSLWSPLTVLVIPKAAN